MTTASNDAPLSRSPSVGGSFGKSAIGFTLSPQDGRKASSLYISSSYDQIEEQLVCDSSKKMVSDTSSQALRRQRPVREMGMMHVETWWRMSRAADRILGSYCSDPVEPVQAR